MVFKIRSRERFLLECLCKVADFYKTNARGVNPYLSTLRILYMWWNVYRKILGRVIL